MDYDFCYFDFEYVDNTDIDKIILLTYRINSGETIAIDLRGVNSISKWYNKVEHCIFVCHNIQAELNCCHTYQLPVDDMQWIDTVVEARMLQMTHPVFDTCQNNKLSTLVKYLDIAHKFADQKTDMYALILDNETYTDLQWSTIVEYGIEDTKCLRELFGNLCSIHDMVEDNVSISHMVNRGEFLRMFYMLQVRSRGMPINYENIKKLDENRDTIAFHLMLEVNKYYGRPIYEIMYFKKVPVEGTRKYSQIEAMLIEDIKINRNTWKKTESGKQLSLERDTLKEESKKYPKLVKLADTMRTLTTLPTTKGIETKRNNKEKGRFFKTPLEQVIDKQYIFPTNVALTQKTGRNSPKPSEGFIMNQSPWLRNAQIKTDDNNIIIEVDYGAQEVAISAVKSGDTKMLEAYFSPDLYIDLAIRAGAAPKDATKESHGSIRAMYKTVQLGLSYGMGIGSLAMGLYHQHFDKAGKPTITYIEAETKAREIYHWHKNYFNTYWNWTDEIMAEFNIKGFIKTNDNWYYYKNKFSRPTATKNFQAQAGGAEMLRAAVRNIYRTDLEVIQTLHDAAYVLSDKNRVESDTALLVKCMEDASIETLGIKIKTEAHIFDKNNQYYNERGEFIYGAVNSIIPLTK